MPLFSTPRLVLRNLSFIHPTILLARGYSVTSGPVSLAYTLHEPPNGAIVSGPPILVLHGLFGSKQNNYTVSRMFAKDLKRAVYALDLRNHGDSPHHHRHGYNVMAEDIEHFIQQRGIEEATLLGHSMGAKVAMALSLRRPELVRDIIAVDNAPGEIMLGASFGKYVQAMRKIEDSNVQKQSEADAILKDYEPELAIRQFLLTNLIHPKASEGSTTPSPLKFRIPVRILGGALDEVSGFPFHPDKTRFEKPALFIRGTRSPYVPDEVIPLIGRFFPYFQLKDVDAGHWLISENPEKFREVVIEFLQQRE